MKRLTAFIKKNPSFTIFFILFLCVVAVAVCAPLIATP